MSATAAILEPLTEACRQAEELGMRLEWKLTGPREKRRLSAPYADRLSVGIARAMSEARTLHGAPFVLGRDVNTLCRELGLKLADMRSALRSEGWVNVQRRTEWGRCHGWRRPQDAHL